MRFEWHPAVGAGNSLALNGLVTFGAFWHRAVGNQELHLLQAIVTGFSNPKSGMNGDVMATVRLISWLNGYCHSPKAFVQ
ncbi:MAG TPA: hypothetical protein V6C64_14085 [Microcoleaceae cyanobacterium]|jgi:hypothetical protein